MAASRPVPAAWWRDDALIALALALLAFGLAAGEWLWRGDRLVYDAGLAWWSRPPADDVVIVAIDDASIEAIGRWPWARSVHATLLERLASAKPRVIVLDLVLSESDPDPRQDELLAAALRHAAPVVLPVAWQAMAGQPLRALEPVPVLRDVARLGASEAPVDADGVLRHAFLEAGPSGHLFPHVAVVALRAGGDPVHDGLLEDQPTGNFQSAGWERRGRFLIRYTGPPGHLKRVSYVDVLRGAVAPEVFRGRHVLVGMTAQGLGDTLATPVNGRQRAMPGVEALAHTMVTLQSGQGVRALSPSTTGAWSAAAVLVLVAAFGWAGTRLALLLAVVAVPAALVVSWLCLWAGIWWSPAAFMVVAALAYPLWSWRRLERAVTVLDREIEQLSRVPGLLALGVPTPASDFPRRDRLAARLRALRIAADTLRAARRFLSDALAGLPTAMLVDDGQGQVLLANPLAARLFEVESPDDLQGLDLPRLLSEFSCQPAVDWPVALADVRRTRQGLAVQARLAGQGDHLIHAHGVDMQGGTRLIVAVTDVAPIKQAERAREELLAFVSHDLRAPATSIALLADLHLDGRGPLGMDDLLREVRRLAGRTLNLADDFVRVAQATLRPLQSRPIALDPLLAEVVADHAAQAAAAGVRIESQAPAGTGLVTLDPSLVQRAVGNMLSNAIKHAPPGTSVQIAGRLAPEGGCVVSVCDAGPGIGADAQRHLMQAGDGLIPVDGQGVGFGLLFVQRVAQRHGGRLSVRTADGGAGALFELFLGTPSGNP
jgi:CHASE2 domain-containing sensor protein/signal transduction histidine kinase